MASQSYAGYVLRYPVETLLELMSSGMSNEEILADYDDLEREDLLAAKVADFVDSFVSSANHTSCY
jgi:hypothetical protein